MARADQQPVSDEAKRLGAYVQQLRTEQKMSGRALAAKARVDNSYLSKVERGLVGGLKTRQLYKIARALGVEVADLNATAGYVDAYGLPEFAPYLRAKYQLPDEAIQQLRAHFDLINDKYRRRPPKAEGEASRQ